MKGILVNTIVIISILLMMSNASYSAVFYLAYPQEIASSPDFDITISIVCIDGIKYAHEISHKSGQVSTNLIQISSPDNFSRPASCSNGNNMEIYCISTGKLTSSNDFDITISTVCIGGIKYVHEISYRNQKFSTNLKQMIPANNNNLPTTCDRTTNPPNCIIDVP
jgi:hypothetical protein